MTPGNTLVAWGPDGTVYYSNDKQRVYALDGTSGKLKWEFTTKEIPSSITIPVSFLIVSQAGLLEPAIYRRAFLCYN